MTLGINYVTLNELFATSDAIMLHCALTDENRELINRTSIQMKDGVVIINTARGELINEEDLIDALCSGKVSFAGWMFLMRNQHIIRNYYHLIMLL